MHILSFIRPLGFVFAVPILVACSAQPADEDPAAGDEDPADVTTGDEAGNEEENLGASRDALRTTNLTFSADLTGDGANETITVTPSNAFIVNGRTWVQHGGQALEAGQIAFVDLNGDKKRDLAVQGYDNRFWISLSTGTGFKAPANWVTHGGSYIPGRAKYGDVNADGKADLVYMGNDYTFWVSTSTGSGFRTPQPWYNPGAPGSGTVLFSMVSDRNGDKKADIIFRHGSIYYWIAKSTGTGIGSVDQCGVKPTTCF